MSNFLERMGLVKSEFDLPDIAHPAPEPTQQSDAPDIDASQVSYDDVIASVYQQTGIGDDHSIFKIKAYLDILPQEMTRAKKQTSIAGILTVNQINVNDLIDDGNSRLSALDAAKASIKDENDTEIAEAEADIEHLKSMIEQAEAKIEACKVRTAASSAAITAEWEAVHDLLEFANELVSQGSKDSQEGTQ